MGMEIERKFLVRNDSYKALAASHSRIVQGYICSGQGRTVRVRLRTDDETGECGKGYLTIKGPSQNGGLSRYEFEKEISIDEALSLMKLCESGIIDKVRWLVPTSDGHTFEVDEFHGDNEGLTVAEVELAAEDEAYERPDFVGEEVTGDRRYYNSQLRRCPYKEWDNTPNIAQK